MTDAALEPPKGGNAPEVARRALPPQVRGIRAAFVFLTRIPVGGFPYAREDWVWAPAHAPFVGAVVGAVVGGVNRALLPLGSLAAATLALGLSMLLTGALHEDGLADTCDALGGGHEQKRVLAILKDSRIGTFGGAALVVSIVGRAALLAKLGASVIWALPLSGCLARVGPVWLLGLLPYVSEASTAKSRDVSNAGAPQVLIATLWGLLALCAAVALRCIGSTCATVLLVLTTAVVGLSGYRYRARAGGVTGDFLGATEQLCELAILVVVAWP